MSRFLYKYVVLAGVFLLVAACSSTKPIVTVVKTPIDVPSSVSMAQLEKAIRDTATARRWTVKHIAPGKVEAHLAARSHVAIVDITFSRRHYSITYKDSENLEYDGSRIHANYNHWVQTLANEIYAKVSAL